LLSVRNIHKSYDAAPLLRGVSFQVGAGEIVCLLGPSGAGKTTLLRIIAGLEEVEKGRVLFEGRDLSGVPVHRRGFGLMFQDLALFPHRTVYRNVAFGLEMQHLAESETRARVEQTLALVGLDAKRFAARDVNHLSGGEQQRVALARSLAPRPRFLMFDEPLGALDRILREQLVADLRALLKRIGMTALYVTHDQEEAFAIADRLVILNEGRVEQAGTPAQVYRHPRNAFVARFLGLTNLLPARVVENRGGQIRAATDSANFIFEGTAHPGGEGLILLRPGALNDILTDTRATENVLRAQIIESLLQGGHPRLVVKVGETAMTFEWEGAAPEADNAILSFNPAGISFFLTEN
jgi:thiamine transport system ATP-binding protein